MTAAPREQPRAAADLDDQPASWAEWVDSTSRLLGIDPALVDISAIHRLTKIVAHEVDRPLAPVASYMLGLAIGARGEGADAEALQQVIEGTARGEHAGRDARA